MSQNLSDLTERLLNAATKAGADAADAVAVEGSSVSIDVLNGKLEHAERSESTEIGIRVLICKRQACISSSLFDDASIETMAARVVAMAQEAPEDPHIGLASPDEIAKDWDAESLKLFDPSDPPTPEQLEDDALRAEAAALAVDGISKVEASAAGYGTQVLHLAATNGFSGGYKRSSRGTSCVAITGEGTIWSVITTRIRASSHLT